MPAAPFPDTESQRLAALKNLSILDTAEEPAFNILVRALAERLKVPIALICFVDTDREWFKAKIGLAAQELDRDIAFCAWTILENRPLIVCDARLDSRFADNPLVCDSHLQSYVGAPLVLSSGLCVGTLCALDYQPRTFTEKDVEILEVLARHVVGLLELRSFCQEMLIGYTTEALHQTESALVLPA